MCIRFSFESPCSDDEHLGKTHFRYGNVKKFITEEDLEKAACKALQHYGFPVISFKTYRKYEMDATYDFSTSIRARINFE